MEKFFVYGTLKIGGRFAEIFNSYRTKSTVAIIRDADLFDLGSYPGVVEGNGVVIGEVHEYEEADEEAVMDRMDQIEGCDPECDIDSLYIRRKVKAYLDDGTWDDVWVYFYNGAERNLVQKIEKGEWDIKKIKKVA